MKKSHTLIFVSLILLFFASCGGEQKASQREVVWGEENDTTELGSSNSNKIIVPFQRTEGNLVQIQISLNGEPFNMLWDTGASITSISALELLKLAKEGKIELNDYQGRMISRIADGSTTESFVFNIHEIYIPGRDNQYLVLHDVDASVSPDDSAPLLIGQNIIQNLPRHIFREEEGVIEFEKQ